MRKQLNTLFCLLLILSILLSSCSLFKQDPLRLYLSGTMQTLEPIIRESGIPVEITYRGDVELANIVPDLETYNPGVDAFGVDNQYWINNSLIQEPTSITKSYSVLLVDNSLAKSATWQAGAHISASDLYDAITTGEVDMAISSASQDDVALSFSLAYLKAIKGTGDPLGISDLSDPRIIEAAQQFYGAIYNTAGNVSLLYQEELTARLENKRAANLIVMSENLAINFNAELAKNDKPTMSIVYVADATNMQIYTFGYVKGLNPNKIEAYHKLMDYLTSEPIQKKTLDLGFRSSVIGMQVENPNLAVFNPDWGILNNEFILAGMPKTDVIRAAQHLYQTKLRPGKSLELCLDKSGSMDGDGISQLRRAMFLLLNQHADPNNPDEPNAAKYFLETNPRDTTTLRMFNHEVVGVNSVVGSDATELLDLYHWMAQYPADGGTSIYNCAQSAMEEIYQQAGSSQFPSVILLTDGQNEDGMSYGQFEHYYKSTDQTIPIYVILLGNADLSEMKKLAEITHGDWCIGSGGVENLAHCFRRFKAN